MVTRGVLLDMAAYYNTDVVKEGTAFNVKEIEEAAKKQGVEIRQGDVVLFHTGWLSLIGKDDKRFATGEPGLGVEGAKYLTGKGVVAIGADNWAVEAIPFESKNIFEVHQILLPMNGTYILENMDTAELAKDKAYEFLFVLGHPRFKGAVQSMINPVAIRRTGDVLFTSRGERSSRLRVRGKSRSGPLTPVERADSPIGRGEASTLHAPRDACYAEPCLLSSYR
jgi:kynurenine formamidase